MKAKAKYLIGALFLLESPTPSTAQTRMETVVARFSIPEVVQVQISNREVVFPEPGPESWQTGMLPTLSSTKLTDTGNQPVVVWIQAEEELMRFMDGRVSTKPISDLEWSVDGGKTWHRLATKPSLLWDTSATSETKDVEVRYRLRLSQRNDPSGEYALQIKYIITNR